MIELAVPRERAKTLATELRQLAPGTKEWRVANPRTGEFCIAFDHRSDLDPERAARQWLRAHCLNWPESQFARYVVCAVHAYTDLEFCALKAADLLDGGDGAAPAAPTLTKGYK